MDQVVQNLPFEIVAVPQDVVSTNKTYTMPIKVKIKMKKGDKGIPQQRVISVPKMRSVYPDKTRRVHSDETIMCFDIHMEPEEESKPRRKSQNKFFHLFKTGKCLGTQEEDENDPPYMITNPETSSETKSQGVQDKKHKYNITSTKDISKPPDIIFGKCKPGGCLDPPFGEDKYQYYKSGKTKQEVKVKDVENCQKPGKEILNEYKENTEIFKLAIKNYTELDASSTCMLYKADPKNDVLNDKYSDSIITYPTRTSSKDLSVLEKSIISKQSSSIKTKQVNIDTYFAPTKKNKSQERKIEALNRKNLNKMKSDLPACIIPKPEPARDVLLQNNVIGEGIHSKPPELVTKSSDKLSHVVELSENILLTVPQIRETIDSLRSRQDELKIIKGGLETEGVINPLANYKGISENKTSNMLIMNERKTCKLENSELSEKFSSLPMINTSTIKTEAEQVLQKIDTEDVQAYVPIFNYSEERNESYFDSNDNITTHLVEEQHSKEIDTIIDHSGVVIENKTSLVNRDIIKKELSPHYLYNTNESDSVMSLHKVQKDSLQLVDFNFLTDSLPNIKNNAELIPKTAKSNKQLSDEVTNVLNNIEHHNNKQDNLVLYEDSNVTRIIKQDEITASVYSCSSKVHSAEKTNEISVNRTNNITAGEIQILKDTNTTTKVDTYVDETSNPKDQSYFNIVSSNISVNALNTPSDFSISRRNFISPINNEQSLIGNNLLRNTTITTARNISDIIDDTQHYQISEKESNDHVNISNNITAKNSFSTHSQDPIPTMFYEKDVITDTETDVNYNNNNNFTQKIQTKVINKVDNKNLTDNQDPIKAVYKSEKDNGLLPTNLIRPHNTSSTAIYPKTKDHVYIDESEGLKVRESNDDINEANIQTQPTFNENTSPKVEFETRALIGENLSNKSGSIVSAKYLNNEIILDSLINDTSKQQIKTDSGNFAVTSSEPTLSDVINNARSNNFHSHLLSNNNSTMKDGVGNISQIQHSNESIETPDKKKNEKEGGEWIPFNETNENNSNPLFKKPNQIIGDLGFQTYLNENGEMILKTFDTSQEPQRFLQDRIFIKRSGLNLNELSFTINSETRLTLKVEKKILLKSISTERSSKVEEIPSVTTPRIGENNKIHYDISDIITLRESLSAVYENDLIPMEQLIRSLRIEIDRIAQYGQVLRKTSIVGIKKTKPTYSKRCVCNRKWKNYG